MFSLNTARDGAHGELAAQRGAGGRGRVPASSFLAARNLRNTDCYTNSDPDDHANSDSNTNS